VWGDQDAFIPRAIQDELLGALTDSRLEVYEGVGHAVHWEQPARFAADIVEFSRYCAGLQLSR
jgi:non-heme chloroperoxidase